MSKCYLCGNERDSHEIGCLEPLIVSEVMSETLTVVADRLGIIIGNAQNSDKVIGFIFRRATEEESEEDGSVTKFSVCEGRNSSEIILSLLRELEDKLKQGDVTLIPQQEALEKARDLV